MQVSMYHCRDISGLQTRLFLKENSEGRLQTSDFCFLQIFQRGKNYIQYVKPQLLTSISAALQGDHPELLLASSDK
jgi:hypothetical protein